jgi:hypothetical protein
MGHVQEPEAPQKAAILDSRDRVLAMYPDLRVIDAHFGSMDTHLDELAVRLDRYPNFAWIPRRASLCL